MHSDLIIVNLLQKHDIIHKASRLGCAKIKQMKPAVR